MPPLGAHMSIAGGYYRAVELAKASGCDCVQLFTKNNNQWRAKEILPEEANRFRATLDELGIAHPIAHSSYLINLASPDEALREKSIESMIVELRRAEQLGIPWVVVHPGSHTTASEEEGLANVAKSVDRIHAATKKLKVGTLLENTAGQGSNLGWRFEHLAEIMSNVKEPERVGVCIDTCHAFAAGYHLQMPADFKATMREFDKVVGLSRLFAIHLNDSKREFGSRVDRHEHIGRGQLGADAFAHLLNDKRFRKIPMYLETPKDDSKKEDWDAMNLATLRGLIQRRK
jgi:deoxyribonuclease-4